MSEIKKYKYIKCVTEEGEREREGEKERERERERKGESSTTNLFTFMYPSEVQVICTTVGKDLRKMKIK